MRTPSGFLSAYTLQGFLRRASANPDGNGVRLLRRARTVATGDGTSSLTDTIAAGDGTSSVMKRFRNPATLNRFASFFAFFASFRHFLPPALFSCIFCVG